MVFYMVCVLRPGLNMPCRAPVLMFFVGTHAPRGPRGASTGIEPYGFLYGWRLEARLQHALQGPCSRPRRASAGIEPYGCSYGLRLEARRRLTSARPRRNWQGYLPLRSVGFRVCGTQARGLNVARAGLNGPQQGPKRLVCHTVPILRPVGAANLGAGDEARRAALDVARAGLDGIAHAGRGRWAST